MCRLPFIALLVLGLLARSYAQQVPNGDLETWTTSAGLDHAQNWLTTDDLLAAQLGTPFATGTTSKTTDKHRGSFAAKLETIGRVPGCLVLGTTAAERPDDLPGGLPFTGRPTSLQMHYKLSGANLANDQPMAGVVLTRTTHGQRQVVAEGGLALTAAEVYTLATIPLQYYAALAPDSIHIVITSGIGQHLTGGTTLYVDNLTLGMPLATRETLAAASLTLFPNPSPDGRFTLDATHAPALLHEPLTVRDITGRVVLALPPAAPSTAVRELDLRGQPAGSYLLHLATAEGPVTRQLHLR